MLRARPELGIHLSGAMQATGLFFADDSTLLAGTPAAAELQLSLVNLYCAGSGALLNRSKSSVLALNRNQSPPVLIGMRSLQPHDHVKFLGIALSQQDTTAYMIARIDRSVLDRLRLWRNRARTIRGRLLIAQSVVFSVIWYFTPHFDVPQKTVQRWQRLLENFVLSRRIDPDDRPVRLISRDLSHKAPTRGGLGIPQIAAFLRRQRILLLQQYAVEMRQSPGLMWVTPAATMLLQALPPNTPNQPLDLLSMSYYRHRGRVALAKMPKWWASTWHLWSAIQWPVTLGDLPERFKDARMLCQPIWLPSSPLLQVVTPAGRPRGLGQISGAQRTFREALAARHDIRRLLDFYDGADVLPNRQAFEDRFAIPTVVTPPLRWQRMWIRQLHAEVTQLAARIVNPSVALPAARRVPLHLSLPAAGVLSGDRLHLFPHLPSSALRSVIKIAVVPSRRRHPIADILDNSTSGIEREWLKFDCANRILLMPVVHDLQFRLAFRLLPVGSRFSFLQTSRPDIICCPHEECSAAETERHLFFDCKRASELWAIVGRDWVPLLGRVPSWSHIVHPSSVSGCCSLELDPAAVHKVWYIFRAIALHQLWTQRNEYVFDGRRPPPLVQHVLKLYSAFTAHLRHVRRLGILDAAALERIIAILRNSANGGIVFDRFSRLLATRDVTRLVPLRTIRAIFGHTGVT